MQTQGYYSQKLCSSGTGSGLLPCMQQYANSYPLVMHQQSHSDEQGSLSEVLHVEVIMNPR